MENVLINGEEFQAEYLGDGVYALFDGYGIWLHANDHKNPTDRVYLEPEVLQGLIGFDKRNKENREKISTQKKE